MRKLAIVLVSLLVLALVIATVGCGGEGEPTIATETPTPKPTQRWARAYETDEEVIQLAVSTFYADVHQGPSGNAWENSAGTAGHWYPTASGASSSIETSTSATDNGNPILFIDAGSNGYDPGEEVSPAQIDAAAVWMGLLVNDDTGVAGAGETDRADAAPLGSEMALYLQEIPVSAMAPAGGLDYNGAGDGGYCWIVGLNGRVFGAYQAADGNWYSGYRGVYP